jgi:hypothetical protein
MYEAASKRRKYYIIAIFIKRYNWTKHARYFENYFPRIITLLASNIINSERCNEFSVTRTFLNIDPIIIQQLTLKFSEQPNLKHLHCFKLKPTTQFSHATLQ